MKNCKILIYLLCGLGGPLALHAQDTTKNSLNYNDRSPIYDYSERELNATDTIPTFETQINKLKISGTIYESDGITPAKDVILYIEQADENGDFDLRTELDKRYVHHRGWVKTDANGQYTFYTFLPGSDRRYNQLQQVFPIIKAPSKPEYEMESFLFNDDPMLSKLCRKKITKKGDPTRILSLKQVDGMFVAQKDIILPMDVEDSE